MHKLWQVKRTNAALIVYVTRIIYILIALYCAVISE